MCLFTKNFKLFPKNYAKFNYYYEITVSVHSNETTKVVKIVISQVIAHRVSTRTGQHTGRGNNAGLRLVHCLRCWPNIKPTVVPHLVFTVRRRIVIICLFCLPTINTHHVEFVTDIAFTIFLVQYSPANEFIHQ